MLLASTNPVFLFFVLVYEVSLLLDVVEDEDEEDELDDEL